MKTVEALIEKSELVYPEKNKNGILNGVPLYETIFTYKENKKKLTFFFYDAYAYFDIGSKVNVIPNGDNIIIPSFQHQAPHQINTFAKLGRKYPRIVISIFIIVLLWIITLGFMKSLFAVLPIGLFWVTSGTYSIMSYLKMKKVTNIKSTIQNISFISTGSNSNKHHYIYEYKHSNKTLIHTSFFPGAKKKNLGKQVDLIYNKKTNVIMEKNKRKNLLISGLFNICFGIIFIVLLFIIK